MQFLTDSKLPVQLVSGVKALAGSNPTSIVTGLTSIIAWGVALTSATAPGLGTSTLSSKANAGTISVTAWMPTSNADPTLIASTATGETASWWAIGT